MLILPPSAAWQRCTCSRQVPRPYSLHVFRLGRQVGRTQTSQVLIRITGAYGVTAEQMTVFMPAHAGRPTALRRDSAESASALQPNASIAQRDPALSTPPQFGEGYLARVPRAEVCQERARGHPSTRPDSAYAPSASATVDRLPAQEHRVHLSHQADQGAIHLQLQRSLPDPLHIAEQEQVCAAQSVGLVPGRASLGSDGRRLGP